MKIRNGFVSNSSSSSFVINRYEKKVDPDELKEDLETMFNIIKKYNEYIGGEFDESIDFDYDDDFIEIEDIYDNGVPYIMGEFLEYYLDARRGFNG